MNSSFLESYPHLGEKILSKLHFKSLQNCRLVCKDWKSFIETFIENCNPTFWLSKLVQLGQTSDVTEAWKKLIIKSVAIGVPRKIFSDCLRKKFEQNAQEENEEIIGSPKKPYLAFPPIYTAAVYGQLEIVKLIYYFQLDFNRPIHYKGYDEFGYYGRDQYSLPIFAAISRGHTEVAKFIASTPQELQNPSVAYDNETPLSVAIRRKNYDLVEFLAPITLNINSWRSNQMDSYIHMAIWDVKIFKCLINLPGIKPNNALSKNGLTPLHEICSDKFVSKAKISQKDRLEMIKMLAPMAENKILLDNHGDTPLHYAVFQGSIEILKILVKYLNVNVRNGDGYLPIDVAIFHNYEDVVNILAKYTNLNTPA